MYDINHSSPDDHAKGFVAKGVSALRYDGHTDDQREVAGTLRSLMPSGVRVLDVGCGTGSVTLIANQGKDNNVRGIEPDATRAKIAKSRGIEVFQGYLTQEYFSKHGKFDVIMFADVLEHIAEPAALLKVAAIGLEMNGMLLVSVPNVAHWTVRFRLLLGRFDYASVGIMDATHLRWFTAKTINQLLKNEGFDVLQCKQTAGVALPEYRHRVFAWIPLRFRCFIIRKLAVAMPRLFGCQHVVLARVRT